jgi:hypothetical protein
MKSEKLFEVKNSNLFSREGKPVSVTAPMIISVAWTAIEPGEPEQYDESFLAALRTTLKEAESRGEFVFIEPAVDKPAADYTLFTAAMKHTARRIKDCSAVVGFAIPDRLAAGGFSDDSAAGRYQAALSEKHPQYVYFCRMACPDTIVFYAT